MYDKDKNKVFVVLKSVPDHFRKMSIGISLPDHEPYRIALVLLFPSIQAVTL